MVTRSPLELGLRFLGFDGFPFARQYDAFAL
jgi:hypothetical protein